MHKEFKQIKKFFNLRYKNIKKNKINPQKRKKVFSLDDFYLINKKIHQISFFLNCLALTTNAS